MSDGKMQFWGGIPRTPYLTLIPYNLIADKAGKVDSENPFKKNPLPFHSVNAYLTKFPDISFGTDWGKYEEGNYAFLNNMISTLSGGSTEKLSAAGIQLLGAGIYIPPKPTDQWTQLKATQSDGSTLSLRFDLVAYPNMPQEKNELNMIVNPTGAHVQGLQDDDTIQLLNTPFKTDRSHPVRLSSYYDWLILARHSMMAEQFSSKVVLNNASAVVAGGTNGNGKASLASLINTGEDTLFGDMELSKGMQNIDVAIQHTAPHGRSEYTYFLKMHKLGGGTILNSIPEAVDFHLKSINFEFSPHVVQIVDQDNKRCGCCPEFAKITLEVESVFKLKPRQMINIFPIALNKKD